jgi:hypothetical protein
VTRSVPGRLLGVSGLVLLVLAVAGAGLYGMASWLGGSGDCAAASTREQQVAAVGILRTPPPDARPSPGLEGVQSECMDDSGASWLAATSGYESGAGREPVLGHYRRAAQRDGWQPVAADAAVGGDAPADSCYRKEIDGDPALLRIHFFAPTAWQISVESSLDGSPIEC